MRTLFVKFSACLVLSILGLQTALAQYESDYVEASIQEYYDIRDSDSLIGLPLVLSQTLPSYYRSSYLYLHDELQDQLEQLIQIGPLPKSPLDDLGGRQILEEHIAAYGRIGAKIKEINLVSKAAKVPGKSLPSSYFLLTDWQLRSYHHQLLRSFAINGGFHLDGGEIFKAVYEDALAAIEIELRGRGLFPKSPKEVFDFQKLSEARFGFVEEIQQAARSEVQHLIDNSPLAIEENERLFNLTEQIREIDVKMGILFDNLPHTRDLLTEETLNFYIEALEYGKKTAEKKYHTTRDIDIDTQFQLWELDKQLAEKKSWCYSQKNHKVIERGYTSRGPPGKPKSLDFEETPFPKEPSSGDKTLDQLLTEAQITSIENKKRTAFEKEVTHRVERYKVQFLELPKWQSYSRTIKSAPTNWIETPESYLRFLATRHLETLSSDLVVSEAYKSEFNCVNQRFYKNQTRKLFSFLENDPTKLAKIESSLKIGYENLEKRITVLGNLASTGLRHEAEELKTALNEVRAVRQNMTLKPRLVHGNWSPRPPPEITNFQESINNEAYYKEVLTAQKRSLERIKAWYGIDAPASIEIRLKVITEILVANEMATSLGEYQKYARDASNFKVMERYAELFPDFFPEIKEMKTMKAALTENYDETFKRFNALDKTSVSSKLSETARNAHKSLTGGKKGVNRSTLAIWRPTPDLENVKSMNLAKDPGGIWLSPEGYQIQPAVPLDLSWSTIALYEDCPDYDDFEWIIDPDAENIEKICFPQKTKEPPYMQNWLNQIKPW